MSIGRPVPRNSNEYLWVAGVIRSVEKLSGTPTRWNGELYEETRPNVAGSALDGGGMTVSELIRGTAEVTGLSQSQVRERLEQADRSQRWAAIADMVIDERLADVLPPGEREAVRTQLMQTMRPHLGDVVATQKSEFSSDVAKTISGHQSAGRAVTALSTTTAELENQYRDQAVGRADPELEHLRKFLGGQTPPDGAAFRASRGDGAAPDNVRSLHAQRGQGQSRE